MHWQAIPYIYDPLGKTYLRISYLEKLLTNFQVIPLVTESWHMGKTGETAETAVSYIPCKILYVSVVNMLHISFFGVSCHSYKRCMVGKNDFGSVLHIVCYLMCMHYISLDGTIFYLCLFGMMLWCWKWRAYMLIRSICQLKTQN